MGLTNNSVNIMKRYYINKNSDGFSKLIGKRGTFSEFHSIKLNEYMGEKPAHFPGVTLIGVYTVSSVILRFDVADRFVVARAEKHRHSVWEDSCVEFFFTPGTDLSKGYFNFEINCTGKIYFQHQLIKGIGKKNIADVDIEKIRVDSSLQGIIDPEISDLLNWNITVEIPYNILKKYAEVIDPASGVIWRGNFQKCADKCSHPHWLTWNKIDSPKPNFHLPEFFGELYFN